MSGTVAKTTGGDIGKTSTIVLRKELVSLMGLTAENMQRMAYIVAELENRGEDLSGLKLGLIDSLRLIAAGRLLPEIVVQYAGRPALIRAAGGLSIIEQRQILETGEVEYVANGESQKVALLSLPYQAIRQVFAEDHMRGAEEQRIFVSALGRRKRADESSARTYRVRADAEKGGLRIGKAFVSAAEITSALADLSGPVDVINMDDATTETATVRLTAVEKQRMKAAEKRRGLPEWHLIREALRAHGLI